MVTSRIWFSAAQKAELWDRWRSGSSAAAISRALDRRNKTGVQLRAALPVGLLRTLVGRTDLCLHRKIVVIGGSAAWTGSMNLVDPRYFKQDSGVGEWVDAMVRIPRSTGGRRAAACSEHDYPTSSKFLFCRCFA
jgi:phosphatidylserine/phosphatidylglycerophosphate/cardiolipin synthase-like enzyme